MQGFLRLHTGYDENGRLIGINFILAFTDTLCYAFNTQINSHCLQKVSILISFISGPYLSGNYSKMNTLQLNRKTGNGIGKSDIIIK